MDVNIVRTEQNRKHGSLAVFGIGKKYIGYKAEITVSIDKDEAENLEFFLRDPEHDFAITYDLFLINPSRGYTFEPREKVYYTFSDLLEHHKKNKQLKLVCVAASVTDREKWIDTVIKETLGGLNEQMDIYRNSVESNTGTENISL